MKDVFSLQEIFENRIFKIPDYQRGYSWENEHRADLINDLELIHEKKHYTGTIVLRKVGDFSAFGESYTKYDIVDGQQRITTLVIFLNEIKKELDLFKGNEEAEETALNIEKRYIKYRGSQSSIYKIDLDRHNDLFFKQNIIEAEKSEPSMKSHYSLLEAEVQFSELLKNKKTELNDAYFNYLKNLINKLTNLLVFTKYEVEDNAEVGIIFEVMNDRGKSLSQLEKVKNFLIYQTDRISLEDYPRDTLVELINNSWKEILQNLSSAGKSRNDEENQFLRFAFINNFYSSLSEKKNDKGDKISINSQLANIHELVKSYFRKLGSDKQNCYEEIRKYVVALKSMSHKYRDLIHPFDSASFKGVSEDFKAELCTIVSQLNRLDIQSIYPLLIALCERFENETENLIKSLKLLEKIFFRVYYIAGRRSYVATTTFRSLANDIYLGKMGFGEITMKFNQINEDYASAPVDDYLADLKEDYYEWKGLEYFLYEYERERCQKETNKRPAFEWGDLEKMEKEDSIEHILPQTIIEKDNKEIAYWTSRFSLESHKKNVKRLGNLVLSTRNSSLRNKGFDEKVKIYKNSGWQIERDLFKYSNWEEKDIDARENDLIGFAKERWGEVVSQPSIDSSPEHVSPIKTEGTSSSGGPRVMTKLREERKNLFSRLIERFKKECPGITNRIESSSSWLALPIGEKGIHFEWTYRKKRFLVSLDLEKPNYEENKMILSELEKIKSELEEVMKQEVVFEYHFGAKWCRLYIINENIDDSAKLDNWVIEKTKGFYAFLKPKLKEIIKKDD